MSKKTKRWLIVGACLVLAGILLFVGMMAMLRWDFSKLQKNKFQTHTYDVTDSYKNICIATDTADVEFVASEDGTTRIVCYEQEKLTHQVYIQEDTLMLQVVDQRHWYDHIGIHFGTPKITVYLPWEQVFGQLILAGHTGDVQIPQAFLFKSMDISMTTGNVVSQAQCVGPMKIETSTGHITLEDIHPESLDLTVSTGDVTLTRVDCQKDVNISVTTGDVKLTNVACKNFTTTGSTGDVNMENVTVTEKITFKRSTGDIVLDGCGAGEIEGETDTGHVRGSLLSTHIYLVDTDTGEVIVPESTEGGSCKITTSTGDITFTQKR